MVASSKRLSLQMSRKPSIPQFSPPVLVEDQSARYAVNSSSPVPVSQEFSRHGSSAKQRDGSSGSSRLNNTGGTTINKVPDYHVKIVVVGDGGCGKTCLLVSYAQGIFPERYVPTVFENYVTTTTAPNGKSIELALWDTAGQEEYDRLRPLSYPDVNVLLVCFAVDSRASLENAKDKWIPEVSHHCPGIPTVLVALKTDLRRDPTTLHNLQKQGTSPITWAEGKRVADETGAAEYMECSAKISEGVSDIFSLSITMAVKENFKAKPKLNSMLTGSSNRSRKNQYSSTSDSSGTTNKKNRKKRHCAIL